MAAFIGILAAELRNEASRGLASDHETVRQLFGAGLERDDIVLVHIFDREDAGDERNCAFKLASVEIR